MLFLLPSGLKWRRELQESRMLEPDIIVQLPSLSQAHSVASFCHFKFHTKTRLSSATNLFSSQKDLTSNIILPLPTRLKVVRIGIHVGRRM